MPGALSRALHWFAWGFSYLPPYQLYPTT